MVAYLDSLGRNFLAIANNGAAGKFKATTQTDIEGNTKSVTDARVNVVMQYKYDMLGAQLYSFSMDGGERWIVNDVMGKPLRGFDSRNNIYRYEYDSLHRPVKIFLQENSQGEIVTEKIIYGEGIASDKQLNLRGKPYQHYDTAGIVTNIENDFKGVPLRVSRHVADGSHR